MRADCFPTNALASRADFQQAAHDLIEPAISRLEPGRALLDLGAPVGHYGRRVAGLESLARLLWSAVPLTAGGGEWRHWEAVVQALDAGTNPGLCDFWGEAVDGDQRLVEMASIGLALAWVPERCWEPLDNVARERLANWLGQINRPHAVGTNNWRLFRIPVNLGLRRVGAKYDPLALEDAMAHFAVLRREGGWCADGPTGNCDNYGPFAIYVYALLGLAADKGRDDAVARAIRESAQEFACEFAASFARDGAGIPFGRSLGYRFAVAAFWGALAVADVEALPWGVLRGLWARTVRWWLQRPIFDGAGLLVPGHGYASHFHGENYTAAGGPYWAGKAFLPLALPEDHPFWASAEEPMPRQRAVSRQPAARRIVVRDENPDHVYALVADSAPTWLRCGAAKYAKFAYSSAFGFSVPTGSVFPESLDSMLVFVGKNGLWCAREGGAEPEVMEDRLRFVWTTRFGAEVRTVLIAAGAWHFRYHAILTPEPVLIKEGAWDLADEEARDCSVLKGPGFAEARTPSGLSRIEDCGDFKRSGEIVFPEPGSNVLASRTVLPLLECELPAGRSMVACAVLGVPRSDSQTVPRPVDLISEDDWKFLNLS